MTTICASCGSQAQPFEDQLCRVDHHRAEAFLDCVAAQGECLEHPGNWHVVDGLGARLHGPDSLGRCLEFHGSQGGCTGMVFVERVPRPGLPLPGSVRLVGEA